MTSISRHTIPSGCGEKIKVRDDVITSTYDSILSSELSSTQVVFNAVETAQMAKCISELSTILRNLVENVRSSDDPMGLLAPSCLLTELKTEESNATTMR